MIKKKEFPSWVLLLGYGNSNGCQFQGCEGSFFSLALGEFQGKGKSNKSKNSRGLFKKVNKINVLNQLTPSPPLDFFWLAHMMID